MWRFRALLSRLRSMIAGGDAGAELDHEIEEHLRSLTQEFVRQGLPPAEAADRARRRFGSATQLRENHRDARRLPLIDNCRRDFHYGFRLLRKKLAFSILAISVLALGIGANTAVYSVA